MPAAKSRAPAKPKRPGPLSVRLSPDQRAKLERAAANANVSLGYYMTESALMIADEELASGVKVEGWTPAAHRTRKPRQAKRAAAKTGPVDSAVAAASAMMDASPDGRRMVNALFDPSADVLRARRKRR